MNDINTFSLSQATSNSDGKTSGSGTAGLYLVFIGGLMGIAGTAAAFCKLAEASNIFLFAGSVITTGAALLGYRKSIDKQQKDENKTDAPADGAADTSDAK